MLDGLADHVGANMFGALDILDRPQSCFNVMLDVFQSELSGAVNEQNAMEPNSSLCLLFLGRVK